MWDNTQVSVTGLEEPEQVPALRVTDGTLPILRMQPMLGRTFSAEDDSPDSPETVILSHGYWQRRFSGARDVIGQTLTVDGRPREIIGVMPSRFRFLRFDPALILPLRFDRSKVFVGDFSYQALARLKPGVGIEQANADVARMFPLVFEKFKNGLTMEMAIEARFGPKIHPLKEDAVGDVGNVLWVLLGTVAMVLLIACANVANLFLVRAEGRQQELAVRIAMGADRRQIARELLFEATALGLLGGLFGLALAYLGIRFLIALGPESIPRLEEITIDPVVLLFTLAISVFAGVLFGLVPVFKYARPHLVYALKEGGWASSEGKERHRARSVLVVSQIALALVLLIGSGLMIRSFQALRNVHPGFARPEEVLTLKIFIPEAEVADEEQTTRTHEQILRRIEQIPGVGLVGLSTSITMDGWDTNDAVYVEAFPLPEGQLPAIRRFKWVSENYFETMGNPVIAGRPITWADIYSLAHVVVVTENFARDYWDDPSEALGNRVRASLDTGWHEIIGVVGNVHDDGVGEEATATMYWPMLHSVWSEEVSVRRTMGYAIRTKRINNPTLLQEVREAVWSVNSNLPLANVQTLEEILEGSMARTSFTLVMLAVAAGVALLLGAVGIYGVISYAVSQRTREIGIRMAIGARQEDVSRLFVRYGLLLTAVGVVVGIAAAVGLTRLMSALLFGVSPLDPVTYVAVAVTLGTIAFLASYVPARRASSVDPVVALRWE
jgi:predicted permease